MSAKIHTFADLTQRISAMQKSAAEDPTAGQSTHSTGKPSVPNHPDGDNKGKQQLPPDGENQENKSQGVPPGALDGAGPTGTDTPSTKTVPAVSGDISTKVAGLTNTAADIAKRAAALVKPADATKTAGATSTPATTPAPQSTPAAPATPAAAAAPKTAATNPDANISFDNQFHLKLASAILECEGGAEMAETFLARYKGREEVRALIKEAQTAHQQLLEAQQLEFENAELTKTAAYQEAMLIKQAFDSASPEEQQKIIKFANAHEQAQRQHNIDAHPALKMAYAQGAEDAQAMMDAEAGGGEATLPGAEGGDPAAGGTPAGPEEIAQALMLLVQSGEIDEATAQQVMASLGLGGGEGGGDPSAGGGAPPAPEEAAGADMAKAASALVDEVFKPTSEPAK